jgi:homoserine dehydrogenase
MPKRDRGTLVNDKNLRCAAHCQGRGAGRWPTTEAVVADVFYAIRALAFQ